MAFEHKHEQAFFMTAALAPLDPGTMESFADILATDGAVMVLMNPVKVKIEILVWRGITKGFQKSRKLSRAATRDGQVRLTIAGLRVHGIYVRPGHVRVYAWPR